MVGLAPLLGKLKSSRKQLNAHQKERNLKRIKRFTAYATIISFALPFFSMQLNEIFTCSVRWNCEKERRSKYVVLFMESLIEFHQTHRNIVIRRCCVSECLSWYLVYYASASATTYADCAVPIFIIIYQKVLADLIINRSK